MGSGRTAKENKAKQIILWLDTFKKSWEYRNPESIIELFDEDVTYFEDAFTTVRGKKAVKDLWKIVPQNQTNICFTYEVLNLSKRNAIVHWKVSRIKLPERVKEKIDGIFQIELTSRNKCKLFKQWRASKTI